jgi:ubiquitin carboxyl-terminal hydrolase L3
MVPQPIKALILVFPYTEITKSAARKAEEERIKKEKEEGTSEVDPTVIFIKQTIGNACGTMALLHALMNVSSRFSLSDSWLIENRRTLYLVRNLL